jgi:phosphatidylserine/phosphatidylglycerophosphate/cardiolipin synthase-like enzyme
MQLDDRIGDAIERAVRAHHRRRLRRIGWEHALDAAGPAWASGEPPPRPGNAVEVLVDGAEALPRVAAELRRAESHVHIAGWHVTPTFRLGPSPDDELRAILAEVAERIPVRVLVWAGAPLPLFRPSRGDVRRTQETLERGTRIRCALDDRERPMHCHHEKLVVVDDRVAFVGGIDLTSYAGNRLDAREHPARGEIGWHDAAARLEGPVVADVAEHFALRWHEVTGETLPAPRAVEPAGETEVQLLQTVPERVYDALPRGDFRILEAYTAALRGASTRGQLGVLAAADDDAGRFLACALRQRGAERKWVYVHAKIGIVDDEWLTLGSANLNEHSLFNDTEVNVAFRDASLARETRIRLWAEHLERPPEELSRRSRALLGPLQSLVVDG